MEDESDDFSDYITHYEVRPAGTVLGDDNIASFPCAASTSPRCPVLVCFSLDIIQDSDEEDQSESRTICLSNDILEEPDECRDFILSEGLFYWPIDADTVVAIAEEVTEKARLFGFNLLVDIRSVHTQTSNIQERSLLYEDQEDDQDSGAAAPGVIVAAYDGRVVDQASASALKSLKRKRIEYEEDGESGGCCVICLEELPVGTEVAMMPCKHHSFHDGCLSTWLERSPCCPLCRYRMSATSHSCS